MGINRAFWVFTCAWLQHTEFRSADDELSSQHMLYPSVTRSAIKPVASYGDDNNNLLESLFQGSRYGDYTRNFQYSNLHESDTNITNTGTDHMIPFPQDTSGLDNLQKPNIQIEPWLCPQSNDSNINIDNNYARYDEN